MIEQTPKKFYNNLYFQVLVAIVIGILLGHFYPRFAVQLKPLGDGFIRPVKMLIGPVIFCTIVTGLAGMQDMKKAGRVGLKAILYFEVLTTIALVIGLVAINLLRPGAGMNVDVSKLDTSGLQNVALNKKPESFVYFLLNIIPQTFTSAFTDQDKILQIVFISL